MQFIGQVTGTTSATLPSHQAGDLIIGFAFRDGSTTAPTLPTGQNWSTGGNNGANTCSGRWSSKIAAGSSEATGTWTNATSCVFLIYRPAAGKALRIGGTNTSGAASTTVTYNSLTFQRAGSSIAWAVGVAGHRSTNTTLESAPSGMTNRATQSNATDEIAGHDTNGSVTSWASTNVSVGGTSSGWRSYTFEVIEFDPPTVDTGPSNATVNAGQTAQFTVSASDNGGAALTYQWQVNTGGGWANVSTGTGGTTATYTTPTLATGDSGNLYRCNVTNAAGTTTSSSATLTVNAVDKLRVYWAQMEAPAAPPGTTVAGQVGQAAATGLQAAVAQTMVIAAGFGAAVASGSAVQVVLTTAVSAGVGQADASGVPAAVSSGTAIAAGIGAADALGLPADITVAVADRLRVFWAQLEVPFAETVVVAGAVGSADAVGLPAALSLRTEISGQVGVADANGLAAQISTATGIFAGLGAADASGLPASIAQATAVAAGTGVADASGVPGSIQLATVMASGVAQADASGLAATISAGNTITAGVGVADAAGVPSTISVTEPERLRVYWAQLEVPYAAAPASPSISGVSDTTPSHTESLTITGTNFGATQGTGGVTIGGVSQAVTSWSGTSITVTVARGTNKYGVAVNVVVTSGAGLSSSPFALTSLQPQTGWTFVDVATPNTTAANRITAGPDIASGDQIAYETVSAAVDVFDDATFSAGSGVTEFDVEVWTAGDGWGAVATQTVGSGVVIGAGVGAAMAQGLPAGIALRMSIAAGVANVNATALPAAISLGTVVAGQVGSVAAAGLPAALVLPAVVSAQVGEATASGVAAGISAGGAVTIACGVGQAAASGVTTNVITANVIAAGVAQAEALGLGTQIVLPTMVTAFTGVADASGLGVFVGAVESSVAPSKRFRKLPKQISRSAFVPLQRAGAKPLRRN